MGASKQPVKHSGLVPTDEQSRSLESSARRKRIRARAGTSKSASNSWDHATDGGQSRDYGPPSMRITTT